jgi:putative endonuclease
MSYHVYVLKSEKFNRYYRGMTQNLAQRIIEHNAGKMRSTKGFVPWELVYSEECFDRKTAREREKFFKSGKGRAFIESLS